jgi:hypothetical protein
MRTPIRSSPPELPVSDASLAHLCAFPSRSDPLEDVPEVSLVDACIPRCTPTTVLASALIRLCAAATSALLVAGAVSPDPSLLEDSSSLSLEEASTPLERGPGNTRGGPVECCPALLSLETSLSLVASDSESLSDMIKADDAVMVVTTAQAYRQSSARTENITVATITSNVSGYKYIMTYMYFLGLHKLGLHDN